MIQPVEIAVVQPARERDEGVWRGSYKKRDRQSGGHRAVSHFQIRGEGLGLRLPLIQFPSFEGGDAQLASCYLGTVSLVLWIIPGAAPRWPRQQPSSGFPHRVLVVLLVLVP